MYYVTGTLTVYFYGCTSLWHQFMHCLVQFSGGCFAYMRIQNYFINFFGFGEGGSAYTRVGLAYICDDMFKNELVIQLLNFNYVSTSTVNQLHSMLFVIHESLHFTLFVSFQFQRIQTNCQPIPHYSYTYIKLHAQ